MAIIAIYGTCYLKSSEYTFFSSTHEIFSKIDHITNQALVIFSLFLLLKFSHCFLRSSFLYILLFPSAKKNLKFCFLYLDS